MVVGLLIIAIPISESAGQIGRFSTVFRQEHFCDSAIQLQGTAAAPRLQFSAGSEFRLLLPLRSVPAGTFPQYRQPGFAPLNSMVCFRPAS